MFLGNSYSVSGVFANSVTITRNLNGVGCQGGVSAALCSAALDGVGADVGEPTASDDGVVIPDAPGETATQS